MLPGQYIVSVVSLDPEVRCTRRVHNLALHQFADLISGLGFTTELCNVCCKVTGEQCIRNLLEGSSHVLSEVLSLHFSMTTDESRKKRSYTSRCHGEDLNWSSSKYYYYLKLLNIKCFKNQSLSSKSTYSYSEPKNNCVFSAFN